MYAEAELLFPFFHNFSGGNLVQTSAISEYDLGGEDDLFKAPEPVIEQPVVTTHPMTAGSSMVSGMAADVESIQTEQLLSEVFYEAMEYPLSDILDMDIKIPAARTKVNLVSEDELPPEGSFQKDLLAKEAMETPFSDILDTRIPNRTENGFPIEDTFQKSQSSGCLSSTNWIHGAPTSPKFLDFSGMDLMELGGLYGMRRAFSEGDIKNLANGSMSLIHSPNGQLRIISNCTTEDREKKLSRYRNKKMKRNFGRKIKYACRKALADNQLRVRGRFAKIEEPDILKKRQL